VGQERKRRRKKQVALLLEEKEAPEEKLRELAAILEKLKERGREVDIQVCPRCKGRKIKRVDSTAGDMSGHMGWTPPKFECHECGWIGRLAIFATNRRLDRKHIALVNEAYELAKKKDKPAR